jgi:MFS family permease
MYSESDLQSAVSAGVLSAESAEALRAHVATLNVNSAVDEEHFRLITGFNDIFVSIACALVIFAAAATGGSIASAIGGILVSLSSWLMAEIFTRKRRMALPSIILLLAFTIGLGWAASEIAGYLVPEHKIAETSTYDGETHTYFRHERYPWQIALMMLASGVATTLGAALHWWRFRVAITIAAGVGGIVILLLGLLAAAMNVDLESNAVIAPAAFICGLAVFTYAMRWDLADPARQTLRADVAFWLHLLAGPLIAHPLFYWMGVTDGRTIGMGTALGVLVLYFVFAAVALAVDRRALLVSALAYVLIALTQIMRSYGAIELNFALTALVIGSALLALSALWHSIRKALIQLLPAPVRRRLPQAA